MSSTFRWPIRVYYEDTDAGGVVYHSNYLNFFERARTEWLRASGINQAQLVAESGIVFVVRRMAIDFIRPARLDNELMVDVAVEQIKGASLKLTQTMTRPGNGEEIAQAQVTVAVLAASDFSPTRLPETIRSLLEQQ